MSNEYADTYSMHQWFQVRFFPEAPDAASHGGMGAGGDDL